MTTGCTKAVEIPRADFGQAAQEKGARIIEMSDGAKYAVRRFALTDSTIVIHDLSTTDPRFDNAELPIVLPLSSVRSMEKQEMRWWPIFLAAAFIGLLVLIDHEVSKINIE